MNEKDAVKIITALEGKGNPTEQESFMLEDALRFLIDKNKNPRDMMYLGGIYYDQRNFDLALKYYEMAANLDYEPANGCLGYVWYYGRTGEKNYEKAYQYFTNAAKRGNLVAQYKIADMYKEVDIPNILDKITEIEEKIATIVNNDPYRYKELINDKLAVEEKKLNLKNELKDFKKYKKELDDVLNNMLGKEASKLSWTIN